MSRSVLADARVRVLLAAIALVGANPMVISPVSAEIAASFGLPTPADVMSAFAFFGIGTAIAALFLAPQADRLGADRTLALSLAAFAIATLASTAAPSLGWLTSAQFVAGLATGVAIPAIYGLATHIAPSGRESETLGAVLTGWTLSFVVGVFLAAVVADLTHWRVVFGGFAAFGVALALSILRTDFADPPHGERGDGPLAAFRVPGIWAGLATAAAFMIAFYGTYSYLGAHVDVFLNAPTSVAGIAALAYGAGFGLAATLDARIDRVGQARARVPVFAVVVGGYLVLASAAGQTATLIGALFLLGGANHLGLNLVVSRLARLDTRRRAAILGLNSAATYVSAFAGTLLFRAVFDATGLQGCAILGAAFVLPVLTAAWLRRRRTLRGG